MNYFRSFADPPNARMHCLVVWTEYLQCCKLRIDLQPLNCNKLIAEVLEGLKPQIDSTHSLITVEPLPNFNSSKTALKTIFKHLLINAIRFRSTPDAQPVVKIESMDLADSVKFTVTDNGIGLSESMNTRMFNVLSREHAQNSYEGAGLGLSICQYLVNELKGCIWAESAKHYNGTSDSTTIHVIIPVN